mmetsp:Transcript_29595/g.63421  ORF Transcript_29595/g.63421 Transcript_29595/m.63421 type:complete len:201 (-) Transcript_29595:288-890(-)
MEPRGGFRTPPGDLRDPGRGNRHEGPGRIDPRTCSGEHCVDEGRSDEDQEIVERRRRKQQRCGGGSKPCWVTGERQRRPRRHRTGNPSARIVVSVVCSVVRHGGAQHSVVDIESQIDSREALIFFWRSGDACPFVPPNIYFLSCNYFLYFVHLYLYLLRYKVDSITVILVALLRRVSLFNSVLMPPVFLAPCTATIAMSW